MRTSISSGPVYEAAIKGDYLNFPTHVFVSAGNPHDLIQKIAITRLGNNQVNGLVHFLSATEAFIEIWNFVEPKQGDENGKT
jgi:hypothetical protein